MRRWTRFISAAAAVVLALLGGVAVAAPPYATEATVSNLHFTQTQVQSGSSAKLQGEWSLSDGAATPAGFTVDLPTALRGRTDSFPLTATDGTTIGRCTVTATKLTCDIDSDYVTSHPLDLHGTFNFWVTVTTKVDEATQETYEVDGHTTTITVTPTPASGTCTRNCSFTGQGNGKWGSYNADTGLISWTVQVAAPATGIKGGQQVTVVDTPAGNQTLTGTPVLYRTNTVTTGSTGYTRPSGYKAATTESYTVNSAGSVSFSTQAGYFYQVHFTTKVTDGDAGGTRTYTNNATITIDGSSSNPVKGTVTYQGGGGDGSGNQVGRFSITKQVAWGSLLTVPGLTFTGSYTVSTPGGASLDGTFELAEGNTWTSSSYPAGSTVTLAENTPATPAGIDWATPVFSPATLTVEGGDTTPVTLTNTASLAMGTFRAHKVVTGTGASLLPAGTTFDLDYTYPAGDGYAAGSGRLELPADGTVVTSPSLPVGATLTLSEATPPAVAGGHWDSATLSATSLTVGRDEAVEVRVTNAISAVAVDSPPTPTATPTAAAPVVVSAAVVPAATTGSGTTSSGSTDDNLTGNDIGLLPHTGSSIGVALPVVGVLSLLLGVMLVLRRSARSATMSSSRSEKLTRRGR